MPVECYVWFARRNKEQDQAVHLNFRLSNRAHWGLVPFLGSDASDRCTIAKIGRRLLVSKVWLQGMQIEDGAQNSQASSGPAYKDRGVADLDLIVYPDRAGCTPYVPDNCDIKQVSDTVCPKDPAKPPLPLVLKMKDRMRPTR